MGKLNTASAECVCMNCTWAHRPKRDPVILVAPRPPERHMGLRSTVPQTKILEANVCLLRRYIRVHSQCCQWSKKWPLASQYGQPSAESCFMVSA